MKSISAFRIGVLVGLASIVFVLATIRSNIWLIILGLVLFFFIEFILISLYANIRGEEIEIARNDSSSYNLASKIPLSITKAAIMATLLAIAIGMAIGIHLFPKF